MRFSLPLPMLALLGAPALFGPSLLLAGCDGADVPDAEYGAVTAAAGPSYLQTSGTSPVDGRPVQNVPVADLASGDYQAALRAAIAAQSTSVVSKMNQASSEQDGEDFALLMDATSGAGAPSTHVVLNDGTGQAEAYVLALSRADHLKSKTLQAAGTYVILDPDKFHPDNALAVEATELSTGAGATVTLDASGSRVAGQPAIVLVVEAIPLLEQPNEDSNLPYFGERHPDDPTGPATQSSSGGNLAFLALRSIRMNTNPDGDGTWNTKMETQMTVQRSDNYSAEFQRLNSYRFDQAYWTSPLFPYGPSTRNAVFISPGITRWYSVPDVNYHNRDYYFSNMVAAECISGFPCTLLTYNENDFPFVRIANSSAFHRAYMNEDDFRIDRFSRRSGDWSGNITTYNFGTNTHQTLNTRLDANNHAWFSSDNVFTSSGFRQANRANVDARTGGGISPKVAQTGNFKYEFVRKMI